MSGVIGHPATRTILPRYNEGSVLRSPRDEDGVGRQWTKARATNDQTAALAEQVKQLQMTVNQLINRPRMMPVVNLHPFQIHSSPQEPGGTHATDRLHFRVHAGFVSGKPDSATVGAYTTPAMDAVYKTDGLGGAFLVDGESWIINDVRDEVRGECPAYDAANIDFTITDGVVTYVWIDNTRATFAVPVIDVGQLASVPEELLQGSIITDDYILIGFIDATGDRTVVKQFIRTDVIYQASATDQSAQVKLYAFVSWHEEYMICNYVGLQLTDVSRASGGEDYEVGDIISFATSGSDLPVSILITAVDENGTPTAFTILDAGQFDTEPETPTAINATGGSGTGLVLNCTFGANTTPVYVALQPEMRESYNPESLSITYPDPPDQTRIVTIDEVPENQVVQPKLFAGDLVPVWRCSNTGVVDPGNPLVGLTLLAVTGREWAKVYEAPE